MATEVRSQAAGRYGIRSLAVLLLLGLYVAVFLAMVGIVHVMTAHDAQAATGLPADSPPSSAANDDTWPPGGVAESPPNGSPFLMPEQTDNSRECVPSAGIHSYGIYN